MLSRRWAEESVMVRAAAPQRQELPEHHKRARRSHLRRYHARIRQCRRRLLGTRCPRSPLATWRRSAATPLGAGGCVYGAQAEGDAGEEFLSYVQE